MTSIIEVLDDHNLWDDNPLLKVLNYTGGGDAPFEDRKRCAIELEHRGWTVGGKIVIGEKNNACWTPPGRSERRTMLDACKKELRVKESMRQAVGLKPLPGQR